MRARRLVVNGARHFLDRHRHLFDELASRFEVVEFQHEDNAGLARRALFKARQLACDRAPASLLRAVDRCVVTHPQDARYFRRRSEDSERRLSTRTPPPDLVVHVFGMYGPFWKRPTAPYVMMLDYTTALSLQNYRPWAPFIDDKAREAWLSCERQAYLGASHLFVFGPRTGESLVADYGVDPRRVSVMRSSGHFARPFEGQRQFGTKRILFNGSDFFRKGGDRVLEAFRAVRARIPEARLAVVGTQLREREDGVEVLGYLNRGDLEQCFLRTDLVVAPARCDPYPGFLIEAMNFGVPCVTSAVDGMPDIVANGSGLVLQACEPAELSKAMIALLESPDTLREMSERARDRIRKDLNWPSIADRMTHVIEHL